MKKITQFLFFISFIFVGYGQQTTLIDFGNPSTSATPGNWNNMTDPGVLNSYVDLIDNTGVSTGETLTLTDVFDIYPNSAGTLTPDPGLPFPDTATRDNFFGEDITSPPDTGTIIETTGGFTLSGLEVGKYYSFTIFASRILSPNPLDNRETKYTITGSGVSQTTTLNPVDNTTNVATILNVQPNGSGIITIQVEKGPNNDNSFGFYYIGAIEMTKTDTTLSSEKFGINGTVSVYPNPSSDYVKISLNLNAAARIKMNVYDITGKLVKSLLNEEKSAGSFVQTWDRSNVASGLYILNIDADGKKQNSKLILK